MEDRFVKIRAAARYLYLVLFAALISACGGTTNASGKTSPVKEESLALSLQNQVWHLIWFGSEDGEKQRVEVSTSYSFAIKEGTGFSARINCNWLTPFWSATYDSDFIYVVDGGYITARFCFFDREPMSSIVEKQDSFFRSFLGGAGQGAAKPLAYDIEGDFLTLTDLETNRSLIFRTSYSACDNPVPINRSRTAYEGSYQVHFRAGVDLAKTVDTWAELYPDLELIEISEDDALAVLDSSNQTFWRIRCSDGAESVTLSDQVDVYESDRAD